MTFLHSWRRPWNRRRKITVALAAATPVLMVAVFSGEAALAHGAPMAPGSRTFLCYEDALTTSGEIKPQNPACAAALAAAGGSTTAFYNWYGVLRSDGAGRMAGFIPDGKLCSGGNPTFAGFDLWRNDWPVTHLTSGASFTFVYNKWAAHPGTFYQYVTKDGFDPTKTLAWSDLESTPFYSVTDPPNTGPVGSLEGKYSWTANLPANKSGRHIIYTVWSRSDSTETFYSCSDVVFDGGKGEVTGLGSSGTPSPSPSTPGPTTPAPTPTPSASPTTGPSGTPSPTGTPAPVLACSATYRTVSSWSGGYQGEVTITNTGSASLRGWMVHFTLPSGQSVSQAWNATVAQDGASWIASNASYNGSLAAKATTAFGFIGSTSATPGASAFSCMPA